jgi:hypothetical protein
MVVNLTLQRSGMAPDAKPPCSAAMADRVRCQLVDGHDYVHHSVFRKSCLKGTSSQLGSQCSQPVRIEPQINDRRPAGTRRFRPPLMNPTVTTA